MWWKILLGVLAVIVLVTLIKAMLLKPKKIEKVKVRDVNIDEKKVAEHLSDAIKFKTISKVRDEGVDWEEFEKFHEYLDKTYPLVAKNTTKEIIDKASLLYLWKGKNPDLEPMAMLAHQDVVPVSEGTEKDWKYEAFSGHIDG